MDKYTMKDIYISTYSDETATSFVSSLRRDLEDRGYSVFLRCREDFSADSSGQQVTAIKSCKDFILILTKAGLERLWRHEATDRVREELVAAKQFAKNIVLILLEGVEFPQNADDMPEELRFLPLLDALCFPEQDPESSFARLDERLVIQKEKAAWKKYGEYFMGRTAADIMHEYSEQHDEWDD